MTRNSKPGPLAALAVGLALLLIPVSRVAAQDLTGIWNSNEGNPYYLRQVGNTLWWAGFNPDPNGADQQLNHAIAQRAGRLPRNFGPISGDRLAGKWFRVPRKT